MTRIIEAVTGRRIADQLDDTDAQRQLAAAQAQIANMGAERIKLRASLAAAHTALARETERAEIAERQAAAEITENTKLRARASGAIITPGADPRPPAVEGRERQLELEVARLKRNLAAQENQIARLEGREVSPA